MSLADSFFHETTIAGLEFYGSKQNQDTGSGDSVNTTGWLQTAAFMRLIRKHWDICNVKTVLLGKKKLNDDMKPVKKGDCANMMFLRNFAEWLQTWRDQGDWKHSLTRETFLAVIQSSLAVPDTVQYLLESKGLSYVLTGKLQSDPLERRFSWFRQLSGANYYVSVRQVLEAEKSIRLKSLIKFSNYDIDEVQEIFQAPDSDSADMITENCKSLISLLQAEELSLDGHTQDDSAIIYYIAGGAARSASKQVKCDGCTELLVQRSGSADQVHFEQNCSQTLDAQSRKTMFLDKINRGGLTHPSELAHLTGLYIWNLYSSLLECKEAMAFLLNTSRPKEVFILAFLTLADECKETEAIMETCCHCFHSFRTLIYAFAGRLFNTFVKNFGREINSQGKEKTSGQ